MEEREKKKALKPKKEKPLTTINVSHCCVCVGDSHCTTDASCRCVAVPVGRRDT